MVIHLVRHACAGQKGEWDGPDEARPLDEVGRRQAAALADAIEASEVGALVSSPTRRCTQTLAPLAAATGHELRCSEALLPDAGPEALLTLLVTAANDRAVLCSHGEAMRALLPHLRASGTAVSPPGASDDDLLGKGTAWRLEVDPATGRVTRLAHLRPSPLHECAHTPEPSTTA